MPTEIAIGGAERAEIQESHRLVAVVTAFTVLFAAILAGLPIGIAVAHNWLAAILLLGLLRLFALCRNRQALL